MYELRKFLFDREMRPADLGRALGFQTSYMTRLVRGIQPVSDAFKWRFMLVYGIDEARSVFHADFESPQQSLNGTN